MEDDGRSGALIARALDGLSIGVGSLDDRVALSHDAIKAKVSALSSVVADLQEDVTALGVTLQPLVDAALRDAEMGEEEARKAREAAVEARILERLKEQQSAPPPSPVLPAWATDRRVVGGTGVSALATIIYLVVQMLLGAGDPSGELVNDMDEDATGALAWYSPDADGDA